MLFSWGAITNKVLRGHLKMLSESPWDRIWNKGELKVPNYVCKMQVWTYALAVPRTCKGHAMFAYTLNVLLACKAFFYELQIAKGNKIRKELDLFLMSFPSSQLPFCFSARYIAHTEVVSSRRSGDRERDAFRSHCIFHKCTNNNACVLLWIQLRYLYPALLMTSPEFVLDAGFLS